MDRFPLMDASSRRGSTVSQLSKSILWETISEEVSLDASTVYSDNVSSDEDEVTSDTSDTSHNSFLVKTSPENIQPRCRQPPAMVVGSPLHSLSSMPLRQRKARYHPIIRSANASNCSAMSYKGSYHQSISSSSFSTITPQHTPQGSPTHSTNDMVQMGRDTIKVTNKPSRRGSLPKSFPPMANSLVMGWGHRHTCTSSDYCSATRSSFCTSVILVRVFVKVYMGSKLCRTENQREVQVCMYSHYMQINSVIKELCGDNDKGVSHQEQKIGHFEKPV